MIVCFGGEDYYLGMERGLWWSVLGEIWLVLLEDIDEGGWRVLLWMIGGLGVGEEWLEEMLLLLEGVLEISHGLH